MSKTIVHFFLTLCLALLAGFNWIQAESLPKIDSELSGRYGVLKVEELSNHANQTWFSEPNPNQKLIYPKIVVTQIELEEEEEFEKDTFEKKTQEQSSTSFLSFAPNVHFFTAVLQNKLTHFRNKAACSFSEFLFLLYRNIRV